MEREVRQLLADKVSGNLLGLWLLVPEHLRLGTWDLLRAWSGQLANGAVPPRLAMHLVHEAALCRPTLRTDRSLRQHTPFDLLVPLRHTTALHKHYHSLPEDRFVRHWAGYAVATETFPLRRSALAEPCYRYIQRTGERPDDYHFKGFACTRSRPEVAALTADFPDRWHIEEFFRFDQHLGWKRAGTLNLHIRLGQMSMALLAQGLIHQLRQRLGTPFKQWDSLHFARDLFGGLEGDLRVNNDTILITYYNAPLAHQWKEHFQNLPQQLQKEGVEPRVPWLYDFKLDFRFK